VEFDRVADLIDGIPHMSRHEGRRLYDHLRNTGAREVLELGTAHGVSSAYMAAAVGEVGGRVTTIDHVVTTRLRNPDPADVIASTGLGSAIERVLIEDSSYTWWLKDRVAEQSDDAGNCDPMYDFIYIDGAHNWTIDGFATLLAEKLLRPSGWLLLDDLQWTYGAAETSAGPGQGAEDLRLSSAEIASPHIQLALIS
jgi:predicted O-methyltransferase YrrM